MPDTRTTVRRWAVMVKRVPPGISDSHADYIACDRDPVRPGPNKAGPLALDGT